MLKDRYDLAVSTTSRPALDAYIEACDMLLSAKPGAEKVFTRALAADPSFALAHAGKARAHQIRGEIAEAREAVATARTANDRVSARERSHIVFHDQLISGQNAAALISAKAHLKAWPRDAMVLSPCTTTFGLIGGSGRAGREAELVELLDGLASAYGDDWWFASVHAFALVETGQRDAARPKIERAVALYPRNANAAHVMSHIYYEDGEPEASRAYLKSWLSGYSREGLYHGHLSWHLALGELQSGNAEEAFRLFTDSFAPSVHRGPPPIRLVDAVSFLWRAELAGNPSDLALWRTLHEFAHRVFPNPGEPFVDIHIALTDAVMGDGAALEARVQKMEDMARLGRFPSGQVAPALSRAFAAFMRQDYSTTITECESVLAEHERLGGSRAQRDVIEFTLLKAYLNAGRMDDLRRALKGWRTGPARIPIAGLPTGQ